MKKAIILLSILLFSCNNREQRLKKEANIIISKIELYKTQHNKIPSSLNKIKMNETEEGPIYYIPWKDSINYIIYFSNGLGESINYYSDTKQWENIDREINNN